MTHTHFSQTATLELQSFGAYTDVPEWVHLLPSGVLHTHDGRGPYTALQTEQLIANSFSRFSKLPIDENHSIDTAGKAGFSSPACGWIVELEGRDNGIWGRVEWTSRGREIMADRQYLGISPALSLDPKNQVIAIQRASLVNTPNLKGLVTLHNEGSGNMDFLKQLAAALGLGDAATEADVLAKVKALLTSDDDTSGAVTSLQNQMGEIGTALGLPAGSDAAKIVAEAKALSLEATSVTSLQTQLTQTQAALADIQKANARSASEKFVDAAIAEGRQIPHTLRGDYISLHMENPSRAASIINGIPVLSTGSVMPRAPIPADGKISLNSDQSKFLTMIGVSQEDYEKTLKSERQG